MAATTVFLDQITKIVVQTRMVEHESIPLIQNILHLTYILNPGAAFGMLAHQTEFFIVITSAVIIGIAYFYTNVPPEQVFFRLGLALQAGGAAGNLIDRLRTGLVVDFIDFRVWPVFNLADSAITVGVILLSYSLLFLSESDDKKYSSEETVGSRD